MCWQERYAQKDEPTFGQLFAEVRTGDGDFDSSLRTRTSTSAPPAEVLTPDVRRELQELLAATLGGAAVFEHERGTAALVSIGAETSLAALDRACRIVVAACRTL